MSRSSVRHTRRGLFCTSFFLLRHHSCHHPSTRLRECSINFARFSQLFGTDVRHLTNQLVAHLALLQQTSHELTSWHEILLGEQTGSTFKVSRNTMLQFVDSQLTVGDGISGHGIHTAFYVHRCVDFSQDVGATIDFFIRKFLREVLNARNVVFSIRTSAHTVET